MDLFPLFQWFEDTAIGTAVRESLWLFPVIEAVHLLALALMGAPSFSWTFGCWDSACAASRPHRWRGARTRGWWAASSR